MLIECLRILQGHPAHKFFPELGHALDPSPFRCVYMFGDEPGSDIYGANACGWSLFSCVRACFATEVGRN